MRQIVTVTIPAVGYNYIPESTEVLAEPGDILAYERTSGSGVLTMQSAQPTNDFKYSGSLTAASTFLASSGSPETNNIHHLRALYTGKSAAMLTYTFADPGNYTITVKVSNRKLPHFQEAETTVLVLEGINVTEIESEPYSATNEAAMFTIQPQTGNHVQV